MAGTKLGGAKARATNVAKDPLYYHKLGRLGGAKGTGHAFAHGKISPHEAGAIGGKISKRGPSIFKVSDGPFDEGFNKPTWKDKLLRRTT